MIRLFPKTRSQLFPAFLMRKLDFSLNMYEEICKALQFKNVVTVQCYLSSVPEPPYFVLRHDVDRSPANALAMAQLEHQYGIRSSYYFRYPNTFDLFVMKQICNLGHEIGYHYEVLDKAKGDCHKAIDLFQKELEVFRMNFSVNTVCMHGNPLTKWDGRDIWSIYNFREYGILGEAFLSCGDIGVYLTDTGRNWNGANNFKDRLHEVNDRDRFGNTVEVIRFINQNNFAGVYLNCHPERWGPGLLGWLKALIRDHLFNLCKKVLKFYQ